MPDCTGDNVGDDKGGDSSCGSYDRSLDSMSVEMSSSTTGVKSKATEGATSVVATATAIYTADPIAATAAAHSSVGARGLGGSEGKAAGGCDDVGGVDTSPDPSPDTETDNDEELRSAGKGRFCRERKSSANSEEKGYKYGDISGNDSGGGGRSVEDGVGWFSSLLLSPSSSAPDGEPFVLSWDRKELHRLYHAQKSFILDKGVTIAAEELLKLASPVIGAAALPIAVMERAAELDCPWLVAMDRAEQAGKLLASLLLKNRQISESAGMRNVSV